MGRQSLRYDTLSSPHLLPNPFTTSDDYGPDGAVEAKPQYPTGTTGRMKQRAASSHRRAVGTTGPFQGLLADREQRRPPSIPPDTSKGPLAGRICQLAMPEYNHADGGQTPSKVLRHALRLPNCSFSKYHVFDPGHLGWPVWTGMSIPQESWRVPLRLAREGRPARTNSDELCGTTGLTRKLFLCASSSDISFSSRRLLVTDRHSEEGVYNFGGVEAAESFAGRQSGPDWSIVKITHCLGIQTNRVGTSQNLFALQESSSRIQSF
jgi:hypothetical protein